jgi:hypothetical protein
MDDFCERGSLYVCTTQKPEPKIASTMAASTAATTMSMEEMFEPCNRMRDMLMARGDLLAHDFERISGN